MFDTDLCIKQFKYHETYRGPPLDDNGLPTVYNYEGSDIRADFPKLHFASNNRDLVITGVQVIDSGTYTCLNTGQNLIVRGCPLVKLVHQYPSYSTVHRRYNGGLWNPLFGYNKLHIPIGRLHFAMLQDEESGITFAETIDWSKDI
ncbi:hypothetical protein MAR_022000 [Mya arenaria]|uniref:Immunoglobulin V-set domain-containing protein n=1 Tax=Mya arenaria TaxID=6604 RepID=A0ABY7ED34_MYAAR|nr:hypothetical protein MAR_022000 [Mya arenaria]